MDVHILLERLNHLAVSGDMGQYPQLNLRIVGCQNGPARLRRYEGLADLAAFLQADRNVLQIRVLAGQPPSSCDGLPEVGMNLARPGPDFLQ
ncbi:hypothetical protein D3C71_1829400 [compost metagenome]